MAWTDTTVELGECYSYQAQHGAASNISNKFAPAPSRLIVSGARRAVGPGAGHAAQGMARMSQSFTRIQMLFDRQEVWSSGWPSTKLFKPNSTLHF